MFDAMENPKIADEVVFADALSGRKAALAAANLLLEALRLNDGKISFQKSDEPLVSIVMVSFNAANMLAMTLYSLSRYETALDCRFEVIVIDNGSNEDTLDVLNRVENAEVILNSENLGFGPACNLGADLAKGRYILFLNPDIEILPGFLSAMTHAFNSYSDVGIVGARLVFPGGILQEAGAYLKDDAQLTHPYLRGNSNASVPEALFLREVSYVSGAALMIERSVFWKLEGFDATFAPAYFEDTDLCLRCAQLGRRVVYQPKAIAIHYENATSPTRRSVEELLDRHRKVLLTRHRRWLFDSGTQPTGFMLRDANRFKFRVLYIDDQTPHIDKGAGLPRANSIVNFMAALGYLVTIQPIYYSDRLPHESYRDIDPRVEILSSGSTTALNELIDSRREYYDLLWISRPHNISLVVKTFLDSGVSIRDWVKSRIVFDTEALFSTRDAAQVLCAGGNIMGPTLKQAVAAETVFSGFADAIVCVSESEAHLMREVGNVKNIMVLGHALDVSKNIEIYQKRSGIMFIGPLLEEGTPNVDSVKWFISEVWQDIKRELTDAKLILVGEISDKIRAMFEGDDVVSYGRVDNLEPVFNSVRLAVAPTRFAAGIPQKVHNCISNGVPMVISPILKAQLDWDEGEGFLSAPWQDPQSFGRAVISLYRDKDLWLDVMNRGIVKIQDECDRNKFIRKLRDICEERVLI